MQVDSFGTRQSNIFTMNKKNLQPDDPLAGIRKKIGDLQEDINTIKTALGKPSIWSKIWQERNWSFALILAVLGVIGTAIWYVGGLILDKHVQSALTVANGPLQGDIHRIDGDVQQIKGIVSVLQAQIAAAKYSSAPLQELKKHRDELKEIKDKLATANRSTPSFWPTSFQVITLLFRATSPIEAKHPLADLSGIHGPGGEAGERFIKYPPGSVLKLHDVIEGITFKDAIIYLDSNVILRNVTFINCTLVLPELQTPPKPLEQIGDQLLSASDLSHLTLSAS